MTYQTLSYIYSMDEPVLRNILTIRKEIGLSQESMALEMELAQSHYGKIERGITPLTVRQLEKIAEIFKIRLIDIYTYPKVYVEADKKVTTGINQSIKAVLQIELTEEKKDHVLKYLFGEKTTELLNK